MSLQTIKQEPRKEMAVPFSLTVEDIMALIPHRHPMLFVDRLEEIVLGEKATGIKNVTINEWFFAGHFPQKPVMPGVFIVEAMAQTAAVLVMKTLKVSGVDHLVYFMSIEKAHFRRPVIPGNTLKLMVEKQQHRRNVWKFYGRALVEDVLVADASYTAMIVKD